MKTPPTNCQVAEETAKLPSQDDPSGAADPRESNQITQVHARSHQFADKVRALQAYCRHAHFILHRHRRVEIARLPGPIREQIDERKPQILPPLPAPADPRPEPPQTHKTQMPKHKRGASQHLTLGVRFHRRAVGNNTGMSIASVKAWIRTSP